jgi:hypothetical protein
MSEGTHSAKETDLYSPPHSQPQFQFITVSHPSSTKDAETKAIIRKHVMGRIGRARRLPNRRRKALTVPLVMPSQDEHPCPPLPSDEVELDEASATHHHQELENGRHESRIRYHSSLITGRTGSFHNPPHAEKMDNEIIGPLIPTGALIGNLCWLGAGPLDPFTKYPFEMGRSDHALVAHSKWFGCGRSHFGTSELLKWAALLTFMTCC